MFGSELTHLIMLWKLWSWLNLCMLHVHHVLEVLFGIVFNWLTLGLWFYKLIFKTCYIMDLKCFSRKWAQEVEFWCVECWVSCLETNLEIPDFGSTLERRTPRSSIHSEFMQSARASKVTLEGEMRVTNTLHVRSSEGMHARARTCVSRSSRGRAPVEREFHASSTFAVHSSEESQARVCRFCLQVTTQNPPL